MKVCVKYFDNFCHRNPLNSVPKSIHAVTSQGFELKVALFVVAYSLDCYIDL